MENTWFIYSNCYTILKKFERKSLVTLSKLINTLNRLWHTPSFRRILQGNIVPTTGKLLICWKNWLCGSNSQTNRLDRKITCIMWRRRSNSQIIRHDRNISWVSCGLYHINIEGAFNSTSGATIETALRRHEVSCSILQWVRYMQADNKGKTSVESRVVSEYLDGWVTITDTMKTMCQRTTGSNGRRVHVSGLRIWSNYRYHRPISEQILSGITQRILREVEI